MDQIVLGCVIDDIRNQTNHNVLLAPRGERIDWIGKSKKTQFTVPPSGHVNDIHYSKFQLQSELHRQKFQELMQTMGLFGNSTHDAYEEYTCHRRSKELVSNLSFIASISSEKPKGKRLDSQIDKLGRFSLDVFDQDLKCQQYF